MSTVTVSEVKPGDRLSQNVLTPLGSVLFYKGRVITPRELEILHAFLVPSVELDAADIANNRENKQGGTEFVCNPKEKQIGPKYHAMVQEMKGVFSQAALGMNIPIAAVRTHLEALLQHIEEYDLLSSSLLADSRQQEDYLYHKSVLTALSCYKLAQWAGLPKKDWMPAALAGLLHDIGNAKLDAELLNKPEPLTNEENETMKRHTIAGYQLLKHVAAINDGVKLAALQHHERADGSGYPFGVTNEKIHPYAKLTAVTDAFHAMTMTTPYRQAASPYLVLEQLKGEAFGKLDPSYVQVFVEKITQFHHGTTVRLNDGRIGDVVFTEPAYPTRPWISIDGEILNLTTDRQLYIAEIIDKGQQ